MKEVEEQQGDWTSLLAAARGGDEAARDRLIERVYQELRRVAAGLIRTEPAGHSLQPTALLHEALAHLLESDAFRRAPNRAYLFGAAARAMRQVLVDHARLRNAGKRGGGQRRLPLDAVLLYFQEQRVDVLALHEALDRLALLDERQSQVITLRFFGGLTMAEIAAQLTVSVSTVESDFRVARAWLRRQLAD